MGKTILLSMIIVILTANHVSALIKCYDCTGKTCATGSCEGDLCFDRVLGSDPAASYYMRGCATVLAGSSSLFPNVPYFLCGPNQGGNAGGVCYCGSGNNCNSATFKEDGGTTGKYTCLDGTGPTTTKTCTGDVCTYSSVRLGCSELGAIFNPQIPADFSGCLTSFGMEMCFCTGNKCNSKRPSTAEYSSSRANITCKCTGDPATCSAQSTCQGNACVVQSTTYKQAGQTMVKHSCASITGNSALTPFCIKSDEGGSQGAATSSTLCQCLTENCNQDIDTAAKAAESETSGKGSTVKVEAIGGAFQLFIGLFIYYLIR